VSVRYHSLCVIQFISFYHLTTAYLHRLQSHNLVLQSKTHSSAQTFRPMCGKTPISNPSFLYILRYIMRSPTPLGRYISEPQTSSRRDQRLYEATINGRFTVLSKRSKTEEEKG